MGHKRKRREDETRIAKKIKKLERKLQRRRRVISSDDSESEEQIPAPVSSPRDCNNSSENPMSQTICQAIDSPLPDVEDRTNSVPEPLSTGVDVALNDGVEEYQLEENILHILGDAPQPEIALGNNIHKDVAARWQDILFKGLSKEVKEQLFKQYLVPANCDYLVAPILNPEAKAAVPDIIAKRDNTIFQKQNQIGVALAALARLTEMIIKNESSKQLLLQPLSDACRILCDSHHVETKTRRGIIMSATNTTMRDALANTNRDKYLFGNNLTENLKAAQCVQKTSESLLKSTALTSSNKNFRSAPKTRGHLNSRGFIQKKPPCKPNESSRGRLPIRQTRNATYTRQPLPPPKAVSPHRRNYRR